MCEEESFGRRARRVAVSDKPFDPAKATPAPKVPKSDEARKRIDEKLRQNFLFEHLTPDGRSELVDVLSEKAFPAGATIIQQGAEGDFFYIIDEGTCDIFVNDKKVLTVHAGDSFGELALMYNAPRAATVKAVSAVKTWAMDRDTFKITLSNHTIRKRDMYEAFLREVPLFAALLDYEVLKLADALKVETVLGKNSFVIKQGDPGDTFYLIERGLVKIVKDGKELGHIESGGYFGELALLTDKPRAASIVTLTDEVVLLVIDRKVFNSILGNLHTMMKRKATRYENYINEFANITIDDDDDDE